MARLKFTLEKDGHCLKMGSGLTATFTDGKGRIRSHWFCAPNKSINHADDMYLQDKLNYRLTKRQCEFIRAEYAKQIKKYPEYSD